VGKLNEAESRGERVFNPDRKTHWGKRKLKRDE
jgi:hypothetical protein